ncbi:hypothetical protein THAOC_15450, partial [Thalassiosira oceanica]
HGGVGSRDARSEVPLERRGTTPVRQGEEDGVRRRDARSEVPLGTAGTGALEVDRIRRGYARSEAPLEQGRGGAVAPPRVGGRRDEDEPLVPVRVGRGRRGGDAGREVVPREYRRDAGLLAGAERKRRQECKRELTGAPEAVLPPVDVLVRVDRPAPEHARHVGLRVVPLHARLVRRTAQVDQQEYPRRRDQERGQCVLPREEVGEGVHGTDALPLGRVGGVHRRRGRGRLGPPDPPAPAAELLLLPRESLGEARVLSLGAGHEGRDAPAAGGPGPPAVVAAGRAARAGRPGGAHRPAGAVARRRGRHGVPEITDLRIALRPRVFSLLSEPTGFFEGPTFLSRVLLLVRVRSAELCLRGIKSHFLLPSAEPLLSFSGSSQENNHRTPTHSYITVILRRGRSEGRLRGGERRRVNSANGVPRVPLAVRPPSRPPTCVFPSARLRRDVDRRPCPVKLGGCIVGHKAWCQNEASLEL